MFHAVNKTLHMAYYVDLEKEFDQVPRRVTYLVSSLWAWHWGVAGTSDTEHYENTRVQCGSESSSSILPERPTVHHSTGNPLPRVPCRMFLGKPISRRPGHHPSQDVLQEMLVLWKFSMEGKRLWVNMGKSKVLISGTGLHVLQKSSKDPCIMCLSGVGTISIFCAGCSCRVHKKWNGISGNL